MTVAIFQSRRNFNKYVREYGLSVHRVTRADLQTYMNALDTVSDIGPTRREAYKRACETLAEYARDQGADIALIVGIMREGHIASLMRRTFTGRDSVCRLVAELYRIGNASNLKSL